MQTTYRRSTERNKMAQFKPKPNKTSGWSHQQELAAMKGKNMVFEMADGTFRGMLLEADQFTVKIDVKGPHNPIQIVIFKSAIHSFREDIAP